MNSRLALFPLQSVVFPNENLPLHIVEDRYIELIDECERTGMTFGIPAYVDNFMEYGTEVKLSKVVEQYDSGAKDVICTGQRIFRITDTFSQEAGKKYSGGVVEFLQNQDDGEDTQRQQLTELIFELYVHLEMPRPKINPQTITSYTLAHKIGLSLQQEYTLLKLFSEKERLSFLINHLTITIPIVQEMNRTRNVIEMNGHFRDFNPMDFEEFKWNN